jgi:hypothetical protein
VQTTSLVFGCLETDVPAHHLYRHTHWYLDFTFNYTQANHAAIRGIWNLRLQRSLTTLYRAISFIPYQVLFRCLIPCSQRGPVQHSPIEFQYHNMSPIGTERLEESARSLEYSNTLLVLPVYSRQPHRSGSSARPAPVLGPVVFVFAV